MLGQRIVGGIAAIALALVATSPTRSSTKPPSPAPLTSPPSTSSINNPAPSEPRCGDSRVDRIAMDGGATRQEVCDDGARNGTIGYCDAACSGWSITPHAAMRVFPSNHRVRVGEALRAEWRTFTNAAKNLDVDGDGTVGPGDLLTATKFHNEAGSQKLPSDTLWSPPPHLDVDGDGWISSRDLHELNTALHSGQTSSEPLATIEWHIFLRTYLNRSIRDELLATVPSHRELRYEPTIETLSDPYKHYVLELQVTGKDGSVGKSQIYFEAHSTACSDKRDNDSDGLIDLADPECGNDPQAVRESAWSPSCIVRSRCGSKGVSKAQARLDSNRDCEINDLDRLAILEHISRGAPYNANFDLSGTNFTPDGTVSSHDVAVLANFAVSRCER